MANAYATISTDAVSDVAAEPIRSPEYPSTGRTLAIMTAFAVGVGGVLATISMLCPSASAPMAVINFI